MSTRVQRREVIQNHMIAMSHPVRREVLRILVERAASPVEIGHELELPTPNVSHHTKRLVELGCAELVEERKVQGAVQHVYRATEIALVSTEEWEELHPVEAQGFVAEIMQAVIDDFLASEKAELVGLDLDFHLTRTPVFLDIDGIREGVELLERVRIEMADIVCRSAERSGEIGGKMVSASFILGLFKTPRK